MCGLHAYKKLKERSTGATDFHGGQPLQEDSNVNPIISLCVTINFIDTWMNKLDKNIACICFSYQYKTKGIFQNILI